MNRRSMLLGAVALAASAKATHTAFSAPNSPAGQFEITRTDAEWRRLLTPAQFDVLRKHGTERPGSSPLDREHRTGAFACAGCDLRLFNSADKYDSGTGWPSFTRPIAGAISTSEDRGWLGVRTEVHCRRCGGHLGHVFNDGPKPTGLRYCMNGVAMKFLPMQAS